MIYSWIAFAIKDSYGEAYMTDEMDVEKCPCTQFFFLHLGTVPK